MNTLAVIIRTKNSASTIKKCLEKLQKQTVQYTQLIIVDSGSTDSTLSIVRMYNCLIINYPSNESFNYSKALNIGISKTNTDYILNLSSHAILDNPRTIEYMLKFITENQSICAVSTYKQRTTNLQTYKWEKIDWLVYTQNNFEGIAMFNPCALIKKIHWIEHPFDETIPAVEDQEWISYFIKKYNYGAVVIKNPYILYQNPYTNLHKEYRDMILIGRHIYAPVFSFRYIFTLITWTSLGSFIKGDFYRVFRNYVVAMYLLGEKLGFKVHFTSDYNKKLKKINPNNEKNRFPIP